MHLTRLRLKGFKSFVDPTELVIADGLTGVVGPNGCGKSNLLEALRWVMGENRARAMRGEGMEDVIFAGTDSRPARGGASVDLVLDNAERRAPAAFNDAGSIEVTRRITREIGSAYAVNGRTVRARDVQMLFADASTGAHSPALVRQGQIAELISAKPKARRRVLEEAAGISGLYQRRHEAELKLSAAEQNLARVDDQIEGLEERMRALKRQAAQAARYREIAEALRQAEALLLWLRWREAEDARAAAEAARDAARREEAGAEGGAASARRARAGAEEALPPVREEAQIAGAVLQRLCVERDRTEEEAGRARAEIESLEQTARQLCADLEREQALDRDAAGAIEGLDAEEARLSRAAEGEDARLGEATEAAETAQAALAEAEAEADRLGGEAARLAAREQAVTRRIAETRAAEERIAAALAGTEAALTAAREEETGAERALEASRAALERAKTEEAEADAALTAAEVGRAEARASEAEAGAARADADGEAGTLRAELRALDGLLARETGTGDQLIDRLSVAPGWEAALGAALGDDLRARAGAGAGETGWAAGDRPVPGTPLPAGAAPLADHVAAPELLAPRLSQTGVVAAEAGDRLQPALAPGQRLVSREGDLWRWDGYRLRGRDASSAAGLRLEQQNRRAALAGSLAAADAAARTAAERHDRLREESAEAGRRESAARETRGRAERAATEAARALSKAEAAAERLAAKRQSAEERRDGQRGDAADAVEARAAAEAAAADLEDGAELTAALEAARAGVESARAELLAARSRAEELRRQAAGRAKRLSAIARERAGWRKRQESAGGRLADLEARIAATATGLETARARPDALAGTAARLSDEIVRAEARRTTADDALAVAEGRLRDAERAEREAERHASTTREARARADAVLESAAEKAAAAAAAIAQAHGGETPAALAERLAIDAADLPALAAAEAEAARLARARDALGAVNLRAGADLAEVAEAHDSLAGEKADLDSAIAKLRTGIRELNREGRERLVAAFDAVNARFAELFRSLFGGGEARLVMVDSEDPLDAGLEILCQPPGKKLSHLSLLSGGEQTLTALSLIFAVFLTNPAPICVLDEVDAPLDDANVTRFCDLLDAMVGSTRTRFLIITHNAITMSRMDRLFGVTMVERGVSQLVSVDLARAAEMAER